MNSRLSILRIVLRKDLRLFWLFAALNAAVIALLQFPALLRPLGPVGQMLQIVSSLGRVLFILVVLYEDAIVSLKHDWLTRPIPGTTLLLAKCVLLLLAICVPAILGSIANGLYEARPWGEALLKGLMTGLSGGVIMELTLVMAFAAMTTGIRQAIIVLLAGIAVFAVCTILIIRASGGDAGDTVGSGWVVSRAVQLTLLLGSAAVLWLQYGSRHARASRVVAGVAMVGVVAISALMTGQRAFAIQKALSADPAAAARARVEVAPGCFETRILGGNNAPTDATGATQIPAEMFDEGQRERAGADAIAFATRLIRREVPAGYRLAIGRAGVHYQTPQGNVQALPGLMSGPRWIVGSSGEWTTTHYWLLRRSDFMKLASANVEMHIDYALSLLAPKATGEFLADGRRAFYPGIGYCGAKFDAATADVTVECYKAGDQPAQLAANVVGAPESEIRASGPQDFTPAILDFWGGQKHAIRLRSTGSGVPRVTVTAFEARAHFDHHVTIPGVLGGTAAACPAP